MANLDERITVDPRQCGGRPCVRGMRIRVVDVRHEQTAGHAADAWARVTGKPGVCLVTAGPGITDVVTAHFNSDMSSDEAVQQLAAAVANSL